jgi:hypothetical protein
VGNDIERRNGLPIIGIVIRVVWQGENGVSLLLHLLTINCNPVGFNLYKMYEAHPRFSMAFDLSSGSDIGTVRLLSWNRPDHEIHVKSSLAITVYVCMYIIWVADRLVLKIVKPP